MTIVALVCLSLAFYMSYNTSKRAELSRDAFSRLLQRHALLCKAAGVPLLAASFFLLIEAQGFGVGIFIGFLFLMTIGSLIILLMPLIQKK